VDIKKERVEAYLKGLFGEGVRLTGMKKMGETIPTTEDVKGFGYGSPLLLEYDVNGKSKASVISTMRVQDGFGHDHFSDRAGIMLWQHSASFGLPKHARSLDVGYFNEEGQLKSCADAGEFFLLMELISGKEYFFDLERVKEHGITELDRQRAVVLSDYLAEIHSSKLTRRTRRMHNGYTGRLPKGPELSFQGRALRYREGYR
jgi:hypothetical protein